MKVLKRPGAILFAIFFLAQVFPGQRPEVSPRPDTDLHEAVLLSAEVSQILVQACYDCHSVETTYPWYTDVVPVSWLVFHHVEEGRAELNFSEWKLYSEEKQAHKLDEIVEVVSSGEMPIKGYTLIHPAARLSDEQIKTITDWAEGL